MRSIYGEGGTCPSTTHHPFGEQGLSGAYLRRWEIILHFTFWITRIWIDVPTLERWLSGLRVL